MTSQLQITFRNMEPSKDVEEWVRAATAKLDSFYAGIIGCHVDLRIPHRHHKKGAAYQIRIDLKVPHGHIVVKREPSLGPLYRQLQFGQLRKHGEVNSEHKDLRRTIDDAFKAVARRLQDYARRQRGEVKARTPLPEARVSKLFPAEGYGFLSADDGREIYFHKNSVLGRRFPALKVGTIVRFVEEAGEKGSQATSVRIPRSIARSLTGHQTDAASAA